MNKKLNLIGVAIILVAAVVTAWNLNWSPYSDNTSTTTAPAKAPVATPQPQVAVDGKKSFRFEGLHISPTLGE